MRKPSIAFLFYFGTLVSSIGSFAFNVALIAFMLQNGFHLGQASLIIGLQRFVPVMVTGIWGHLSDLYPPVFTVALAEGIAALCSVALFLAWNGSETNYVLLLAICVVRAVVVSLQVGSRARITKLLSDETYSSNSKNAIWLNKATQGATLAGGLLAWLLISYFSLETAIIVDALTFLFNGLIVLLIPNIEKLKLTNTVRELWHRKFRDLFHFNSRTARIDILLVIPMMGTVAYMSRLAGADQSWTGIYMAGYGLAVWTAGFMERSITSKFSSSYFWVLMGFAFLMLGILKIPILILAVLFLKDLSFWIVFHRISAHIQTDTPLSCIGGVMSARNCVITAILTSGEALVGAWSNMVSLEAEGIWRGLLGIGVGLTLFYAGTGKVPAHDRPAL